MVWKGGHRGTCLRGPKDSSSSGEGHGLSKVGAGFSKVGPSFLGQVLRTVLTPCWGRQEVTQGGLCSPHLPSTVRGWVLGETLLRRELEAPPFLKGKERGD